MLIALILGALTGLVWCIRIHNRIQPLISAVKTLLSIAGIWSASLRIRCRAHRQLQAAAKVFAALAGVLASRRIGPRTLSMTSPGDSDEAPAGALIHALADTFANATDELA